MSGTAEIRSAGMFTTVQDLGRGGHTAQGVPESGAMDAVSVRLGNRLVGNPDDAAALEFTLMGPEIVLDRDAVVCVTGGGCPRARVGGGAGERPLPPCTPVRVCAGEVVSLGPVADGARGYLCVAGGFDVPVVLGSRSTLAPAGLGGHAGRALRAGDRVAMGDPGDVWPVPEADARRAAGWLSRVLARRDVLRVTRGLHADRFGPDAWETLARGFRVSDRSNRVGVRLEGDSLVRGAGTELLSEGTSVGSVQVPGEGLPIVLGVDRPTTGGYPVIACVIAADLCLLGQLRPRDAARFESVTREEAVGLLRSRENELDALIGRVGA